MKKSILVALGSVLFIFAGCSKNKNDSSASLGIPHFRPPVAETAGSQFAASSVSMSSVSPTSFQSHFFGPGPTNVLNILAGLDERLSGIRPSKTDASSCINNVPTPFTVTVQNAAVVLQLQCYETMNNTGLRAFGKKDDTWYIFEKIGDGALMATATTLADGKFSVEIFGSVGIGNGADWSSGSYGTYHIEANTLNKTLEMTVAGIGFGFCGAYLNSDGTNSYIIGSEDGIGQACQASATVCTLNANLAGTGNCSALLEGTFNLLPMGRLATVNHSSQTVDASAYPASPNVQLNGNASDSVHFGPTSASELPSTVTSL